ncbi:MAG: hypothetical protein J6H18_05405 [Lachnospiraceae bacterium]|nr:hypothetical protein [Lachnospiraceae bacterium]
MEDSQNNLNPEELAPADPFLFSEEADESLPEEDFSVPEGQYSFEFAQEGEALPAAAVSDAPEGAEAEEAASDVPEEAAAVSEVAAEAAAEAEAENTEAPEAAVTEPEAAEAEATEPEAWEDEEEAEEDEYAEESEDEDFVPPVIPPSSGKTNRKHLLLVLLGTALVIFLVYVSTSLIYKVSRGESWDPFAFLKRKTTEAVLPTVPTVPIQVLTSLAESTGNEATPGATTPDSSQESPLTSGEETESGLLPSEDSSESIENPDSTPEESTQEPTTEEPTTEEPTTEEATTEEPTTQEPTTQEPTTQEPTTEEPTTEEAPDFTTLEAHLEASGLGEKALKGSQLVIAQGDAEGKCLLYFFEKTNRRWALTNAIPVAPASLGSAGMEENKPAGSSATPCGYFTLGPVFGQAASILTSMPYQQIMEGDRWITDPASEFYNQMVGKDQKKKDWSSALELSRQDAFKYAVLINYNTNPVDPALGSAVFLNVQTDKNPDGSIGVRESTIFALLQWLNPESDPHILIYSYEAHHE